MDDPHPARNHCCCSHDPQQRHPCLPWLKTSRLLLAIFKPSELSSFQLEIEQSMKRIAIEGCPKCKLFETNAFERPRRKIFPNFLNLSVSDIGCGHAASRPCLIIQRSPKAYPSNSRPSSAPCCPLPSNQLGACPKATLHFSTLQRSSAGLDGYEQEHTRSPCHSHLSTSTPVLLVFLICCTSCASFEGARIAAHKQVQEVSCKSTFRSATLPDCYFILMGV